MLARPGPARVGRRRARSCGPQTGKAGAERCGSGSDAAAATKDLQKVYVLRRILNPMGAQDAIEFLLDKLRQTKNNGEFFDSMSAWES